MTVMANLSGLKTTLTRSVVQSGTDDPKEKSCQEFGLVPVILHATQAPVVAAMAVCHLSPGDEPQHTSVTVVERCTDCAS